MFIYLLLLLFSYLFIAFWLNYFLVASVSVLVSVEGMLFKSFFKFLMILIASLSSEVLDLLISISLVIYLLLYNKIKIKTEIEINK